MWITVVSQSLFTRVNSMLEAIIGLAVLLIGWGSRLESQVKVLDNQDTAADKSKEDLKELLLAKLDVVIARGENIDGRLERLERHVFNGHYSSYTKD